MTEKADTLKAQIAEISNDITEIDADLQEIIDKLAAAGGGGDGITDAEVNEISNLLGALKGRTRAAADKVPEQ